MMENYEDIDIRLGHINSKELGVVQEVQIQQGLDEQLNSFERSQASFDFGAEIRTTNVKPSATATAATTSVAATVSATSETQPKANSEIKTKTLPQLGEQNIGANHKDKILTSELDQLKKSLEKSLSEADDDDEDEDDNEDYKSRYRNS